MKNLYKIPFPFLLSIIFLMIANMTFAQEKEETVINTNPVIVPEKFRSIEADQLTEQLVEAKMSGEKEMAEVKSSIVCKIFLEVRDRLSHPCIV